MKRNIFIVGSCYPAQIGGPSNSVYRICKGLREAGNNVEIYTTLNGLTQENIDKYQIARNREALIDSVPVTFFNYYFTHKLPLPLLGKILAVNKDSCRFHLSSIFYFPNFLIMLILKIKGGKYTIAPRGEFFTPALKSKGILKKIYLFLIKPLLTNAEYLISTSLDEKKIIQKILGNDFPVRIIPNYIDVDENVDCTAGEDILYLGRLNPHKCIENLIEAYLKLPENITDSNRLLIAGNGELKYSEKLKNMTSSSNNISFLGKIEGDAKVKVLEDSAILVLPSKSENFGNVIVEALAQGTPAIACFNSPWSELPEYECGYFTSNSANDILSALLNYFSNSDNQKLKMSMNAHNLAATKYSLKNNIKHIEEQFGMK